jgi:ubiquinone/menaquinone biosynthesis C-methylase UbiE
MPARVALARFLIRLSSFIESLTTSVMRPDDLIEYSRATYTQPENIASLSQADQAARGLYPYEVALLEAVPIRKGSLLVLGVGGGREAIPLARMGYTVTGLDFVPDLVRRARENALSQGLQIAGAVQEISRLDMPAASFDVIWLGSTMYSCVPTRSRRLAMLRRVRAALVPGGYFVCQFHWYPCSQESGKGPLIRKAVAYLTLGNRGLESGDMLLNNQEFIHSFGSEDSLRAEFSGGGFEIVRLHLPEGTRFGGAVLRAPEQGEAPVRG